MVYVRQFPTKYFDKYAISLAKHLFYLPLVEMVKGRRNNKYVVHYLFLYL